jgi:hypothetical protein
MSALKSDRTWMVGGAVAGLVIAALAWLLVVNPELSNASSLDEQTLASQTQNISLQSKLHRLQADNANKDALVASLREARTELPIDSSLADFTRQLTGYAAKNGVSISGITAGEPAAMTSAAPVAAPAPAAGTGSTTATGSAAGAPAARTSGTSLVSPAGQLYGLPLTVVVKGRAANDLAFLADVQGPARRAALVSGAQLTGDTTKRDGTMQLTIQLQVFVAPQAPSAVDALLDRLGNQTK